MFQHYINCHIKHEMKYNSIMKERGDMTGGKKKEEESNGTVIEKT